MHHKMKTISSTPYRIIPSRNVMIYTYKASIQKQQKILTRQNIIMTNIYHKISNMKF